LAGVGCLTLIANGNFHLALLAVSVVFASFILDLSQKGRN